MVDLRSVRSAIVGVGAKYGVVELSVFGSTVRGEADEDSDVDLLYVRGPQATKGLAYFGLRRELEELLACRQSAVCLSREIAEVDLLVLGTRSRPAARGVSVRGRSRPAAT